MYSIIAGFSVTVPPEDEENKDEETICKEIKTYFDNLLMGATEYEPLGLGVKVGKGSHIDLLLNIQ